MYDLNTNGGESNGETNFLYLWKFHSGIVSKFLNLFINKNSNTAIWQNRINFNQKTQMTFLWPISYHLTKFIRFLLQRNQALRNQMYEFHMKCSSIIISDFVLSKSMNEMNSILNRSNSSLGQGNSSNKLQVQCLV